MVVATRKRYYTASIMNANQKKQLALKAVSSKQTITELATYHQVSRKFIHHQKDKVITAIDEAFDDSQSKDDDVLYHLPVTKLWLQQFIVSLVLDCRASFRCIQKALNNLLDYNLSIGTIANIVKSVISKAQAVNEKENLSDVTLGAHDELFHLNKPVLAGIDIRSLYCYLLTQAEQRDGDTWAVHLWDLQDKSFAPERIIADDGDGLRKGHETALPDTPCDMDNFHITKALMDCRRFFRNRLKTASSERLELSIKMEKAKLNGSTHKYSRKLGNAVAVEKKMQHLSKSIDTLVSWMEHDVLNKAGPNLAERLGLYDFIVDEFKQLEAIHPHRIHAVRITLKNQRNLALAYVGVLDDKFRRIAIRHDSSLETIWELCALQRCQHGSDNYAIRSIPLHIALGNDFDAIEDAVCDAMHSTERTSSMVENLNSRLRPYFSLRQEIGFGFLDLLRFYLNHSRFTCSDAPHRKGKSPAECLTGKPHTNWLEMLGFTRFQRAA